MPSRKSFFRGFWPSHAIVPAPRRAGQSVLGYLYIIHHRYVQNCIPTAEAASLEPYLDLGLTTFVSRIDPLPEDVNVILFWYGLPIPPVIAVIIVWIPVVISVWIPGTTWVVII
jgi:hypothetical protein